METKTTKREFVEDISVADKIITEQDAKIVELEQKLAVKPTAAAEPAKVEPKVEAPTQAAKPTTPVATAPKSHLTIGDTKLTGISRAIAARNAELREVSK